MRTITKLMHDRLQLQSNEAMKLGLVKTAEGLDSALGTWIVRDDSELYSYAQEEVKNDIEQLIWLAMVRTADYYGHVFDAQNMQSTVEKMASDLMEEVRKDVGNTSGVGAYEPAVPGEYKEQTTLEIDE